MPAPLAPVHLAVGNPACNTAGLEGATAMQGLGEFDYVIVGAGSAGCVLANRLSADPSTRVLLLEAGGSDRKMNIRIPVGFAKQFRTDLDWNYDSEPEPSLIGRSMYLPRG